MHETTRADSLSRGTSQLLDLDEVADRLRVSKREVYRLIKRDLRSFKLGRRRLVREDDLTTYIDNLPVAA